MKQKEYFNLMCFWKYSLNPLCQEDKGETEEEEKEDKEGCQEERKGHCKGRERKYREELGKEERGIGKG